MLRTLLDLLFPPRPTELLLRASEKDGLIPYRAPRTSENGIVSLLPYDNPVVRAAILEAQFHDNTYAATLLGNALAQFLAEEIADRNSYERSAYRLVPIPFPLSRTRVSGQTERIARFAATVLDIPLETELLVREPLPQNAFALTRAPDPDTIYIVIDVVTTDATLQEAWKVFRDAGGNAMALVSARSFGNSYEMQYDSAYWRRG